MSRVFQNFFLPNPIFFLSLLGMFNFLTFYFHIWVLEGYTFHPPIERGICKNKSANFEPEKPTLINVFLQVKVGDLSSNLSLARFLRENLHLTGTKISCGQGGCGVCIVTASIPIQSGRKIISVNSVSWKICQLHLKLYFDIIDGFVKL